MNDPWLISKRIYVVWGSVSTGIMNSEIEAAHRGHQRWCASSRNNAATSFLPRTCSTFSFSRFHNHTGDHNTNVSIYAGGGGYESYGDVRFVFYEIRESVRVTRRQTATVRRTAVVFLLHQELGEQAVVPLGRAVDRVQRVEVAAPQVEVLHPTLLAPADELRELRLGPVVWGFGTHTTSTRTPPAGSML